MHTTRRWETEWGNQIRMPMACSPINSLTEFVDKMPTVHPLLRVRQIVTRQPVSAHDVCIDKWLHGNHRLHRSFSATCHQTTTGLCPPSPQENVSAMLHRRCRPGTHASRFQRPCGPVPRPPTVMATTVCSPFTKKKSLFYILYLI